MKTGNVLYINEKQAKTMLNMKQVIGLMEKCFREYASGNVLNPTRLIEAPCRGYLCRPIDRVDPMGVKLAGCWSTTRPDQHRHIVLFVPQRACLMPLLMEPLSNIRTGAVVGVRQPAKRQQHRYLHRARRAIPACRQSKPPRSRRFVLLIPGRRKYLAKQKGNTQT